MVENFKVFKRRFNLSYLVCQGLLKIVNYLVFSNYKGLLEYFSYCSKNINNILIEMKRYSFYNISSFLRNKFNLVFGYYLYKFLCE